MTFVVYLIVLVITAGSVMFGLDWLQAPMSPMPPSKYELHAAKPPPVPPSVTTEVKPASVPVQAVSKPETPPAQATAAAPASVSEPAPIVAPKPVVTVSPPVPKCDVDACTAAYRSFTAEDCTYQPLGGPRRLCEKGTPPAATQITLPAIPVPEPPPIAASNPAIAVSPPVPKCDVYACAAAYHSFTAEDCTYQPQNGPRRLCDKGTPPAAAQVTPSAPQPATPNARAQATCNIAACSQSYISFSANDCTYQPLEGPRKLCEK